MPAALHRGGIDIRETDAAAGDFGFFVAFVSGPRQRTAHKRVDQPAAFAAAKLRQRQTGVDIVERKKGFGKPMR